MNKSWLGLGGKVAIVTGGASGIGFQMVNELLNNGAKVVVADLHGVEGKQENQSYFIPCDVSNKKMVMDTVDKTVELFGKIDILINNAGINSPRLLVDDRKEKPEYELTEDVDEQSVESFEHNLKDNLYKWWNRMSS
ncbi:MULTISPECIES: SDR family NAD(P)-dependent oxidoreductase, partial [Clostridia]|uniref:SDR family NAD(P)-dependent oxidoreductase n=1 Tax=Clostridia TaxID=186801 RepID=UPI000EA309AA